MTPLPSLPPDTYYWPELVRGALIQRYKRFLIDVRLNSGETVTAHCPNSGSMRGLVAPGNPVYLSRSKKAGRKTSFTLEMIQLPDTLVGVNTLLPNLLVRRAIQSGRITELNGYQHLLTEKGYGENSRIDILLTNREKGSACYVEVKNCTLVKNGRALFPDAVTIRGLKHLRELQNCIREGHRAVIFYLIQRMDAQAFSPADDIDPEYGKELRRAAENGVEIMAWEVRITPEFVHLSRPLPIQL